MVVYLKAGIKAIDRLTLKQLKAGTFGWKGKAKDYPGALNIKRGLVKKDKPKLRIV